MPETTTNYGLKKPLPNEHYDIAVQNENMDTIDAVLAGKLDKTGAGSDVTVEFIQASSRANIASGEKLSILFGKLRKWFADLKTVAWTGSYSDLTDKPAIPAALADLNEDSMHRTVTDAEKAAWNAKSNLALGETATTAYRGDRGKIAYDHSQTTGNPHGTTPADIGAAAAVHTHSNLSVNGKALTGAVTLSASDVGAAAASHTHGNISSDGKIGSTANRAIYTGTNGVLQAGTLPVSAGGTGATTAASARANIGAAAADHTHTADELGIFSYKVGDVLITTRTDLSDDWILCNGAKIDSSLYPQLANQYPSLIDSASTNWVEGADIEQSVKRLIRVGDYVYAIGLIYNSSYGYSAKISRVPVSLSTTTWSTKQIQVGTSTGGGGCLIYEDSTFVMPADRGLYYCTDSNPIAGSWSFKKLSDIFTPASVAYGNGYWVAAGQRNDGIQGTNLYYGTSLTGSFNSGIVGGTGAGGYYTLSDIAFANNYWVAIGESTNSRTLCIFYKDGTPSPIGGWTKVQLNSGDNFYPQRVKFINNTWVALAHSFDSYKLYYCTGTAPTGTWNTVTLPRRAEDIWYEEGYWIITSGSGYLISKSLSAPNWIDVLPERKFNQLLYTDETWFATERVSDYVYKPSYAYKRVPTISIDHSYAYIKGK